MIKVIKVMLLKIIKLIDSPFIYKEFNTVIRITFKKELKHSNYRENVNASTRGEKIREILNLNDSFYTHCSFADHSQPEIRIFHIKIGKASFSEICSINTMQY